MSKPGEIAIGAPDEAIEEALRDHHLDEVADMIKRSHAQNPALQTPLSDSPAEYLRASK